MKLSGVDNFAKWREKMRASGKLISKYPKLKKDGDLAELIGVVLGDGHLSKFPRTEELTIFSNANNPSFVKRYARLMQKMFRKKPYVAKVTWGNCIRIRIYQKNIQKRLGVPFSPRAEKKIKVPRWILGNKQYIVRYLRGLYEAEGSHCIHLPTSTFKFFFSNKNETMLRNVFRLMKKLGFHPHRSESNHAIQISRKSEVEKAIKLLRFRYY